MELVVIRVIIALCMIWVVMSLGKLLVNYANGYQPITSLFNAENSTGFNAIYRILSVPVLTVLISIILYVCGFDRYTQEIWLVAVYFFILQATLIILLGRWRLVNKSKFLLFHALSILLTYYLYSVAISKGLTYLLPDEANIRTEMWLIIAVFLYGIFRNIPENYHSFELRKESYVKAKARHFKHKYRFELDKYDEKLVRILIAIMVYENFNRPALARILEAVSFADTRHVMQVYGAKNDADSIRLTVGNIEELYKEFSNAKFEDEWEEEMALEEIFNAHNSGDETYGGRVAEIYKIIS